MPVSAGLQEGQRSGPLPAERSGGPLAEEDVLQAARAAGRGAVAADRDRRLAPEVVAALREAGFARHFVPRRWGGREGGFAELVAATALVGGQCPSAAWCGMLWAAHGRYAARLPEEAQRELWGGGPDTLIAAALVPPSGEARPVPGGWLLDGRWDCVSGVDFCDWVLLAAPVPDAPARVLALPRSDVVVHDTWRSTGLRGTGSNRVEVCAVFVPDRRSCALGEVLGAVVEPGASSARQASAQLAGGLMFCAPALGAARLALRSWNRWARTASAGRPAALGDTTLQRALARSAAEIDAVALLLARAAAGADAEPTAPGVEAVNRRDAAVAAEVLVEAVERLFRMGGAHARDDTSEVQRAWRDVHTVAAHGALRLDAAACAYAAWGDREDGADRP
ncbi:acyl-CoA dehydrogenase family protein [Streptacidiphilus sp. N1-3]|uniref:Acyl-CoA dehydrogenase family protein n=1 Tax=Streptacidiphilus alkalitolerans TaxID=3342712 RepID=A0ABV6XDG7_9ACTN